MPASARLPSSARMPTLRGREDDDDDPRAPARLPARSTLAVAALVEARTTSADRRSPRGHARAGSLPHASLARLLTPDRLILGVLDENAEASAIRRVNNAFAVVTTSAARNACRSRGGGDAIRRGERRAEAMTQRVLGARRRTAGEQALRRDPSGRDPRARAPFRQSAARPSATGRPRLGALPPARPARKAASPSPRVGPALSAITRSPSMAHLGLGRVERIAAIDFSRGSVQAGQSCRGGEQAHAPPSPTRAAAACSASSSADRRGLAGSSMAIDMVCGVRRHPPMLDDEALKLDDGALAARIRDVAGLEEDRREAGLAILFELDPAWKFTIEGLRAVLLQYGELNIRCMVRRRRSRGAGVAGARAPTDRRGVRGSTGSLSSRTHGVSDIR